MNKKVGVSHEEMALPYYKFFTRPLAEVPAEKLAVLSGGPSPVRAVPFEERNLFLKGEDKAYCQTGYGVAEDDTAHGQSMVCAIGEGGCPAAMTHVWAPYKNGILFRSRFWIGYALVEGAYRKILPEGARVPDLVPKGLFAHNIKEFTNLAAILPELYQEFGSQPL